MGLAATGATGFTAGFAFTRGLGFFTLVIFDLVLDLALGFALAFALGLGFGAGFTAGLGVARALTDFRAFAGLPALRDSFSAFLAAL